LILINDFGESAHLCLPKVTTCNINDVTTTPNNQNLPSSSDDMSSVKFLRFKSSNLVVFPENLFDIFPNLEGLEMQQCHVHIIKTFGNVSSAKKNVTKIYLSKNQISTLTDYVFARVEKLEELDLSYNLISDLRDKAFIGLNNLKKLQLTNNKITKLPNNIFIPLSSIRFMYLDSNQIVELDPIIFRNNQNLQKLILDQNSGLIVKKTKFHRDSKAFKELVDKNEVLNNFFRNNSHHVLHPLRNLRILSLSKNNLNSLNIDDLPILNKLEQLNVASNSLISITNVRSMVKNFPGLKNIDISRNEFDCNELEHLMESINPIKVFNRENRCVEYYKIHSKLIADLQADLQHIKFNSTIYFSIFGVALVLIICLSAGLYCMMKKRCDANHMDCVMSTRPAISIPDERHLYASPGYEPMQKAQPRYEDIKIYDNENE
jgi:Leucine-rich repeat (LRR) protein